MLHIEGRRSGNSIRTLCGLWNAPVAANLGWKNANGKSRPKELCPACARRSKGGK